MNWHVKEFSQLSGVSIRALRYYDEINLLNPSTRTSGGYRTYTEKDLVKIKLIIEFKSFRFSLRKIKMLLIDGLSSDIIMSEMTMRRNELIKEKEKIESVIKDLSSKIDNWKDKTTGEKKTKSVVKEKKR
jgi:DNA-binding transcriptional MerR regulator